MIKVFVYGTLRVGGNANNLLEASTLEQANILLKGYQLFDHGYYPFAVQTKEDIDEIYGDLYSIDERTAKNLDVYEGEMYKKVLDHSLNCWLYIKKDNDSENFPRIESGDWLQWKGQNIR